LDNKEAVRLIIQAIDNLPKDYNYKDETWEAVGFLNIRHLSNTSYDLITCLNEDGSTTEMYEELPFNRFNPERTSSPSMHIGNLNESYKTICSIFGRHDKYHDTYKQDASWHIEFRNGEKVSIGNFKDGHNYLGKKGKNLVDIKRWDVWGTIEGLKLLKKAIKEAKIEPC